VICLSPLYLTRPNCLRELMWAMDMCAADKTKKLCVLPMHPSVSFAGCKAIVKLAAAGCAAQVILPVDDRCKDAPTQLNQLKGHKLSDIAVSLLQRLSGSQNVGINAEWLKLQPWRSDAEGENWEETSQPWAGPCEGQRVQLHALLKSLSADVQAAVQAAVPAYDVSAFTDVEDHELQSLPPSQDHQSPPDTALLRSTFPQLLLNFSEAEAVKLLMLGLRDADAVDCITHGFLRNSKSSPSQPNPVDQVFRMAADMSGCFTSPRSTVSPALPAPAAVADASAPSHPVAASSMMVPPSAGGLTSNSHADDLALKLQEIKISDDAAVLADMSARLRRDGIMALEDLRGLSMEELQEEVSALNLKRVQLKKLFDAVSSL
jgi:hypothetical protein